MPSYDFIETTSDQFFGYAFVAFFAPGHSLMITTGIPITDWSQVFESAGLVTAIVIGTSQKSMKMGKVDRSASDSRHSSYKNKRCRRRQGHLKQAIKKTIRYFFSRWSTPFWVSISMRKLLRKFRPKRPPILESTRISCTAAVRLRISMPPTLIESRLTRGA
jgi:hypothetical protein